MTYCRVRTRARIFSRMRLGTAQLYRSTNFSIKVSRSASAARQAIDEDQHAGILLAEVAGALELQLLAVMEDHPGALGAAPFAAGGHDRSDLAEGDGVVHALGWGVERLGGLALVEVVDQPAGEAAAVAGGDAARERSPRREVSVGGTAAAGAELDALEGVPGDQHPAVAPVVDVDPAVAVADFAGVGEYHLAAVERVTRALSREWRAMERMVS